MSSQHTTDRTLRLVLLVLAVLVLAPVLMMILAVPMMGLWGGMGYGGMMGGYGSYGGYSPVWGFVLPLVWLVVLVVGGYLVFRRVGHGALRGTDPALEELRLAYARGDLTEEEYESRRSTLEGE